MKDTIFSNDIKAYELALISIPDNKDANEVSFVKNDTRVHARSLFLNMLKRSEKSIKLKSSMFCKDFYGDEDIFNAFKDLKERKIQILIETEDFENRFGQKEIIEEYKKLKNVQIKIIEKDCRLNDYLLIDNHSFRYELKKFDIKACENSNLKNVEAIALINANKDEKQNKKVKILNDSFDKHF